jgi:hypothetical protein
VSSAEELTVECIQRLNAFAEWASRPCYVRAPRLRDEGVDLRSIQRVETTPDNAGCWIS